MGPRKKVVVIEVPSSSEATTAVLLTVVESSASISWMEMLLYYNISLNGDVVAADKLDFSIQETLWYQ